MADIKRNQPLKQLNTFGIDAIADFLVEIESEVIIPALSDDPFLKGKNILIMGGGSNLLFTKNYEGVILHVKIPGISVAEENADSILVKAGAGVIWDDLVAWAVSNNLGGIENLSLIPGTTGAAPVQNIGAYGMEIKDVIERVEGYDLVNKTPLTFNNHECGFRYRNSVFKENYRNRFIITQVYLRLRKPPHKLVLHYGNMAAELPGHDATIADVRNTVISIRESKLPDHEITGNAGSFFKNPVIEKDKALAIKIQYPDMPLYTENDGLLKLSAAWLIDQAGCKGIIKGQAGTHPKQPLVLINLGGASGTEIYELAMHIKKTVMDKFGIELEPEVNIL